jgi:Phytanoyl-CoA dioxygenase (PhyH)
VAKTESTFHLSCEDLQKFRDTGIVGPFRLVTPHEIEPILKRLIIDKTKLFFCHRVLSRSFLLKNILSEARWGKAKWEKGMHLVSPVTYALSTNSVILDKIESIHGPNLLQWGSLLITQRPGVMHSWHVDADCLECDGITVWLALKNVNEMTAMKVITRSHHLPVHPAQLENSNGLDTSDDNAVLESARALDSTCEMNVLDVKPGEFVILSSSLWHSIQNRSQHPRSAIILQYSPTRTKVKMPVNEYQFPFVWDDRPVSCCLVRGIDEYGRNLLVNPPTSSVPKPISEALSRLTLPPSL